MIRSFIYLDSEKLRSFSSQLFEGVTERVVEGNVEAGSRTETQKGPVASGRMLGDIFAEERSTSELKFLEDYAYTLFEEKLGELDLLNDVSASFVRLSPDKQFVKITAKLQFNDLAATVNLLENFNKMGESFWRATNEQMAMIGPNGPTKILSDGEARKKAAEMGLQMHQKVSDATAYIIDLYMHDLLEANMVVGDYLFSAPLKRESLREKESALVHKYARVSSIDFSMVGVITRSLTDDNESKAQNPDVRDARNLKNAMRTLGLHMGAVEESFGSAQDGEIVIDPISIYSVIFR